MGQYSERASDSVDALSVAQGLMVEITNRLEVLATEAVDLQLSDKPASELAARLRTVLTLVDAHCSLLIDKDSTG